MTWYRTLGPITYTNGDRTEHVTKAGVRVSLTPTQYDEVKGMVALDKNGPLYYPKVDVLAYDALVLFPSGGGDDVLYLDMETGVLYRWVNNAYAPLSLSSGSWDFIANKPPVVAEGDTAEEARNAIGAGPRYPAAEDIDATGFPGNSVHLDKGDVWLSLGISDNRLGFCQSEAASAYYAGFDEEDIENVIKGVKEAGGSRLRAAAFWGEFEPTARGSHDWTGLDRFLDLCEESDIEPVIAIVGGPVPSYSSPTLTDFANACAALAMRYGSQGTGQLRNFQIWNEPNHGTGPYFGSVAFGAAGYTNMLIAASNAIRQADPNAFILAAGLMSTVTFSTTDISPSSFLTQLYDYGAGDYFDAFAFNWYSSEPDFSDYEMPTTDQTFYKELLACRAIMAARGDKAKQVWITEFGVDRHTVTDPVRRGTILGRQVDLMSRHDWIGCWLAYNWRDSHDTDDRNSTYGLVDFDFVPQQPSFDLLTSDMSEVPDGYITNDKIVEGGIHGSRLQVAGTGGTDKFLAYAADGTLSAVVPAGGEGGGGLDEEALTDLIDNPASDTRVLLDSLYKLIPGTAPVGTVHANAGTGAGLSRSGTRTQIKVTITTGTSPVSGGTLATFALSGYSAAPAVVAGASDALSAATFPCASATTTVLTLAVAGELEPATAYSYNIILGA